MMDNNETGVLIVVVVALMAVFFRVSSCQEYGMKLEHRLKLEAVQGQK